ncbi:MAG: C-terminal binding protein [Candidatus Hydrogenedentes bacterium]|nr:C-terminal binding protein [Candidatus Hydrogenedentota bacterium]
MLNRVVILDAGYGSYEYEKQLLTEHGFVLEAFEGGRHDTAGRWAFARGAIGAFVRWTVLGAAAFDALPSVKYVVRYGVGYDNVDVAAATARGVLFCNVQGYANHSVSDHALALILACVRDLRTGTGRFRQIYNSPPRPDLPELKDLTLGIVGLGRIGGILCMKAKALFRQVLACDPYIAAERFPALGAIPVELDTLLTQSDVVSIHCNLTEETRLMFDKRSLERTRPNAILVNTARGAIVDEDALLSALDCGRLYAAGLDVYSEEPPPPNQDALLNHPHVVATGHYAWYSVPAGQELQRRAARNMLALLQGHIPEDCLNPEAGS